MEQLGSAPGPSRYDRLRALVGPEPDPAAHGVVQPLERLCTVLTTQLSVAGAAVKLMSPDGASGVFAAADERSRAWGELQFSTGEGPCVDAFAHHQPILVTDLTTTLERWPGYASAALDAGVRSAFAFPLHVGGAGFGVLEVLATEPGSLGQDRMADALTFAQLATEMLVDGLLTTGDGDLEPGLASAMDHRSEVHQAQGMLMVALGVTLAEALLLMRSYAFSHDQTVFEVARLVHDGDRLDAE